MFNAMDSRVKTELLRRQWDGIPHTCLAGRPGDMKIDYSIRIGAILGFLSTLVSIGAAEWIPTPAPAKSWTAITCSADGKKVVALSYPDSIWTSTNGGLAWTSNAVASGYWYAVASSAEGNNLVACVNDSDKGIYTSSNSGRDWVLINTNGYWRSVASSADGRRLAAVGSRGIFTSSDFGSSWRSNSMSGLTSTPNAVASSADGMKLACAERKGIYTSTNAGETWISNSTPALKSTQGWWTIACSADGKTVVAPVSGNGEPGAIYTSKDFGQTWVSNNAPLEYWNSAACSADGNRLFAVASHIGLYTSPNAGATWVSNDLAGVSHLASSADGNRQFATATTDSLHGLASIFISETTVAPVLGVEKLGNDVVLSWIVPSKDFRLQAIPDLSGTNWQDLNTPPTLNLDNIHHELVLPPLGTGNAFRLKSVE